MPAPAPFFRAFGPLLFGRPARQAAAAFARTARLGSLEELYALCGEFLPQALLAPAPSGTNSRQRIFTPQVTFWAFVAQVLGGPRAACRDVVRQVEAWWRWGQGHAARLSASTSAYCQARSRLDPDTLEIINHHLVWSLERHVRPADRWLGGRTVKVVDGTNLSMPDTAANQEAWPQSPSQAPGLGFPLMKLLGLFSLSSGALLARASGRWSAHESRLCLDQLAPKLQGGDVLLADRGFCSFFLLGQLLERGVDAVVRLHQGRRAEMDFRRVGPGGRRLGAGDKLVVWTKPLQRQSGWPAADFAALPETLTVRLVRVTVAAKGFRTRRAVVATTLLDAAAYPAEEIAALYRRRWAVEGHFAQLKTVLGLDVLRCKRPALVAKEVAVTIIAYHLARCLMQRAAHDGGVALERLSFAGSLAAIEHWSGPIQAAAGQPRRQVQLVAALLTALAAPDNRVPERPERSEPRVKKRRAKNYQLLTRPRHAMGNQPHRNRPGKKASANPLS